jgi:hypothetical protein
MPCEPTLLIDQLSAAKRAGGPPLTIVLYTPFPLTGEMKASIVKEQRSRK